VTFCKPIRATRARLVQHRFGQVDTDEIDIGIHAGHQAQLVGRAASQVHHSIAWLDDFADIGGMEQVDRRHRRIVGAGIVIGIHIVQVIHHQVGFRYPRAPFARESLTQDSFDQT
jgi:hypothetical protein